MTRDTITYVDCDELTVRIAEACIGNQRPKGKSAQEALEQLRKLSPESVTGFQRAALSAAEYIAECCNANYPGSVEIKKIVVNEGSGKPS
jgi:hypothetical protein